ncbi:MAG: polyphosphate kinase 1, partial [Acidimicrobiales bacterium]
SDLSLNPAVLVRDPSSAERRFARVKIPHLLPRFVVTPDGERFVALEHVIAAHLDTLFPGMEIESHFAFRVTRNADLTLEEDEADDLLAAVEMELRRRRFRRAVRLEIDGAATPEIAELLARELELDNKDVFWSSAPIDLSGLWTLYDLERPDLKQEPWLPVTQPRLLDDDGDAINIFDVLGEREVLVHHPYESFTTSVEAFIKQAGGDPDVLAIKLTLYRTSGDSPIVKALIRAAERGKQVAVLVELKARFDEQANIAWAKALEDAGVHVVYGIVGLKTHCKIALVVRQEPEGVRRYCHIGTGNYNPRTARLYEDVGLLTSDADIGRDLTDLFNFLTGYSRQASFRKVAIAPINVRQRIIEWIDEQAALGPDGRIILKMNGLDDRPVIDALYAASQAGTPVDLIVRSICCVRPGVSGLSDNIRVRASVGRYLEHSRIFVFGNGADRRHFLSSADLRARNLDRRIEVVVPIETPALVQRLEEIIDANLEHTDQSWELLASGTWRRCPASGTSAQAHLQELAVARSRQAPHGIGTRR